MPLIFTSDIFPASVAAIKSEKEIKDEVESLFDVKVAKVRTHTLKNKKHAFVKFRPEYPAIDIATKLGMM